MLSLLAEGKIEARVESRLPLERSAEALGLLASGKASGKVVLVKGLGYARNPASVRRRGASHAI